MPNFDETICQCPLFSYLVNGWCEGSCPAGYFGDLENRVCISCVLPCATC